MSTIHVHEGVLATIVKSQGFKEPTYELHWQLKTAQGVNVYISNAMLGYSTYIQIIKQYWLALQQRHLTLASGKIGYIQKMFFGSKPLSTRIHTTKCYKRNC